MKLAMVKVLISSSNAALVGQIEDYNDLVCFSIFRRLLQQESGAYWTFLLRFREVTLIGASPERHISIDQQRVAMTPISGTYRFPAEGPSIDGLIAFLADEKENDELSMVLDEELKMMTRICQSDVIASGPSLIKMSKLAHTGYGISGSSRKSISEILKESMFAPTVVGSPIENAARVIAKYEPEGRSYYSGFAAIIEDDEAGLSADSAILIRTAELSTTGTVRIGVGATVVRDSDPWTEAEETVAKVAGLKAAICGPSRESLFDDLEIKSRLAARADKLSGFWIGRSAKSDASHRCLSSEGRTIAVIDNEDRFTSMLEYLLRHLGFSVRTLPCHAASTAFDDDIVIIGPGPGDPRNQSDPRVSTSTSLIRLALQKRHPLVAICLGHQIMCSVLGFKIERMDKTRQGMQKQIDFFGVRETVGFYNTFSAVWDGRVQNNFRTNVDVARDSETGHIHGVRGSGFSSMQFHPESVLTVDGPRLLSDAIHGCLKNEN
ncbi:chorismate-binding protein [Klebsiella pneumoniae]|nr:chorismate-binding protein [Klebsiella pneumoniae]